MENPNKKIKIEDGFIFSFEDTIKEEKDIKIEPISDVEDEEDDDDPVIFTPKEKPGRKTRGLVHYKVTQLVKKIRLLVILLYFKTPRE